MNERIKKLAEQVGISIEYLTNTKQIILLEKFAELIVKDCIEELEVSKKGDIYTGDLFDCEWNDCIDRQIEVLKEEFGVK